MKGGAVAAGSFKQQNVGLADNKKDPLKSGKPIERWGHKADRSYKDGWVAGEKHTGGFK